MTVYCATTNPGKIAEFRTLESEFLKIEPLPGLAAIPPCDETGSTFEENAIQKAVYYAANHTGWVFAEDSGLEVDAVGGEPGVYSARYAGPAATDEENNRLLLKRLGGSENRRARYVCVIALAHDGQLVELFQGSVEGEIVREPQGTEGFGYDPLFFYPPFNCTFGDVARERKQTVSHRGVALRLLLAFLKPKT